MKNGDRARAGTGHLRELSRTIQVVLLLLVGLIAVCFLWLGAATADSAFKDFYNAIATGLLVSAAFGLAQTLITGRVTAEVLRASVIDEVRSSLSVSSRQFHPTHDIPASSTPSPRFNELLMQDLLSSSIYWFIGVSARYTAARVSKNTNVNLQVSLILPDTRRVQSLDNRASYAFRNSLLPGRTLEEIRDKMRHEAKLGLIGLLEARLMCRSIQLILTPTPGIDRYEIFRDSIWVTLYSDKGPGRTFPRALRFAEESILYRSKEAECAYERENPSSRVIDIPRSTSPQEKLALFDEVFGTHVTTHDYESMRAEYRSFARQFLKESSL